MTFNKKAIALSLLFSSSSAFAPTCFTSTRSSSSSLDVSVVTEFVKKQGDMQIMKTFETETPESVGVKATGIVKHHYKTQKNKRRSNKSSNVSPPPKETMMNEPDLDFFTLHSSAVSHLTEGMPVDDIFRAMKRAQNRKDAVDLATIAAFLFSYNDSSLESGVRGSMFSRLAVAAFSLGEKELGLQALIHRRLQNYMEQATPKPQESAAIVRGLFKSGLLEEGWKVLEEELGLDLDLGGDNNNHNAMTVDIVQHRARALTSIASRFFHEGQPQVAAMALDKLGDLGMVVFANHNHNPVLSNTYATIRVRDLDISWGKLVIAATECQASTTVDNLPSDLAELVFDAMMKFPCLDDDGECVV